MSSSIDIRAVKNALSPSRLSTYEAACPLGGSQQSNALILYRWNAEVSSALLTPLHICEVVTRNAISDVLQRVYGNEWPWSDSFERSLPHGGRGRYKQRLDMQNTAKKHHRRKQTGKVIPELKFVFWQKLLTRRFDQRLWDQYLRDAFPNLPHVCTTQQGRQRLYQSLESIRLLRNRIAHHEPIFSRDLDADFRNISWLIKMRCVETEGWMINNMNVLRVIENKPHF